MLTHGVLILGRNALIAWLTLLAVSMNLFVLKEIPLLGFHTTASEPLAVGYLLTLNLFQERYGKKETLNILKIILFLLAGFVGISYFHLGFFSVHSPDYASILSWSPRLFLASMISFICVQLFDRHLFAYLRERLRGKHFLLRVFLVTALAELIDSTLFTYLGLWGWVSSPNQIIFSAVCIKLLALLFFIPLFSTVKRTLSRVSLSF